MKRISAITLLTAALLFGCTMLLHAQTSETDKTTVEQQGGKSLMIQFADPAEIDAAAAKQRGLIPVTPGEELSDEIRQKMRGQAVRFVTAGNGQLYLEILHPDSAEAMSRHAFEVLAGNAEARPPAFDPLEAWRSHLEQAAEQQMTELPLRIRTEARSGNRLEVFLENNQDIQHYDLEITPTRLPDGWQITQSQDGTLTLPPYRATSILLQLEMPQHAEEEMIHIQLNSDKLIMPISLKVRPAGGQAEKLPDKFELHGNYPNPFNPATTISYSLPESMHITIEIYDTIGRRVARLVNQQQGAGTHNVVWDASSAASGTYIYRLVGRTGSNSVVFEEGRLTLIK